MPNRLKLRSFLRSDFARHGFLVFVSSVVVNFASYAFNLVLSRWLGIPGYGVVASLTSILVVFSIPSAVLATVVVKLVAELKAVADVSRLQALSRRIFELAGGAAGILFLATALAHVELAKFLHIGDVRVVFVAGLVLALSTFTTIVRALLQGTQDFRRFAASTVLQGALRGVLGISAAAISPDALHAMLGWLAAECVAAAYTAYAAVETIHADRRTAGSITLDWSRIAQTTAGIGASAAILTTLGSGDMILVKHFFSPTVAGLYGALSLGGRVLTFGLGFLPTVVLPKATARAMRGESALSILAVAAGISALAAAIVLTFVAEKPAIFIGLLVGAKYQAISPYVFEYCVAASLLTFASLAATYKTALHRYDFVAPAALVALAEFAAVALFHDTIAQVVRILVIGNLMVVIATSWDLWRPVVSGRVLHADERLQRTV